MSYLELLVTIYVVITFLFTAFRVWVDCIVIKERSVVRDLQNDRKVLQQNYSTASRDNDFLRETCSELQKVIAGKETEG